MRILIIEDERALTEALSEALTQHHYAVDVALNGTDGLEAGLTGIYDVIILDLMLPGLDGLTVLARLRIASIPSPVLILTARAEADDKITGLDAGADDYLTKPFVMGELLARVRALCRRPGELTGSRLTFGDLTLDRNGCMLCCGVESVRLSTKELGLLELLLTHPGTVVSRERLIQKIWGYDCEAEYNNIEVYLSFLRRKLGLLSSSVRIKAARGLGYFVEDGV